MDSLAAALKWVLSFRRSEWEIGDYPIRYKEQGKSDPTVRRWSAQIINWWQMFGSGDTKEEALQSLAKGLHAAKQLRGDLPRPGTVVPLQFASSDEIDKYWGVASRIIDEVLGFNSERVFVSDASCLWDFCPKDDLSPYYAKIQAIFGADVSHIESGNIVEIAKYISDRRP